MNKWKLQFRDAQTERAFNNNYLESELKVFRYSTLLGIVTYLLFLTLDYVLYDAILFYKFVILRVTISTIIAIAYSLSFKVIKTPDQYQFTAIFVAISCLSSHIAFTFFIGVDDFYFYTANVILITFISGFLNIRYFNLIFIAFLYIFAHLTLLAFNLQFTVEGFAHQAYGIMSIVVVSLIGTRILESNKRQDFLNKRLIESQKMALESSINEKDKLLLMLEERNEELDAFNHSVSHDLKTPLRNVISFSKLLERRYRHQLDEDALECLDFIVDGADNMNTLIDDLLRYSKIRHTALQLEMLKMDSMVAYIFMGFTQSLKKKPVLIANELPAVKGDKILIKQVWDNLISNAIKYSSKTEKPEITVGATTSETEVTYYIKDNGVGFDMKFADRLFELFSRLHSDHEYAGTGVGLSLVDKIVKRHNGKVWAESVLKEGSTFYFTLPIS
ncbi:MAG: signal transduction histidine kinase [Saprospiraceae bacterium]|jgi:signal transduction histidine kinase